MPSHFLFFVLLCVGVSCSLEFSSPLHAQGNSLGRRGLAPPCTSSSCLPLGSACTRDTDCGANDRCNGSVCVAPLPLGSGCTEDLECQGRVYTNDFPPVCTIGTCSMPVVLRESGDLCGQKGDCFSDTCQNGVCVGKQLGESCISGLGQDSCDAGLVCNVSSVCVQENDFAASFLTVYEGGNCTGSFECRPGLACVEGLCSTALSVPCTNSTTCAAISSGATCPCDPYREVFCSTLYPNACVDEAAAAIDCYRTSGCKKSTVGDWTCWSQSCPNEIACYLQCNVDSYSSECLPQDYNFGCNTNTGTSATGTGSGTSATATGTSATGTSATGTSATATSTSTDDDNSGVAALLASCAIPLALLSIF